MKGFHVLNIKHICAEIMEFLTFFEKSSKLDWDFFEKYNFHITIR
ncbi:MAG: hypothetical protein K0S51_847 [Bacillales bacterium]|jgi:hypothetical protein|nr:hypothetical protein [Bacillales bacterium]